MAQVAAFIYGAVAYAVFFVTILYAIGFTGNIAVPKSVDSGAEDPTGSAFFVNLFLLALFAIQHSVMARPAFKRQWTKIVPEPIERSTYVLLASLILLLLYWQWRPMTGIVWNVQDPGGRFLLQALFWIGWVIVFLSTFMIGHFDLFGLKQVYFHLVGKGYPAPQMATPGFYRYIRHPIMAGFIIAFWATPAMSVGHLLFAVVTTVYILVAVRLEERDLAALFGEGYERYRRQVSMLIPSLRKK